LRAAGCKAKARVVEDVEKTVAPEEEAPQENEEAEAPERPALQLPSERLAPPPRRGFDRPMLITIAVLAVVALYFIAIAPFRSHSNEAAQTDLSLAALNAKPNPGASTKEEPKPPAPPPPAVPHEPAWRISTLAKDPSVELIEATVGKRAVVVALTGTGLSRSEAQRILNAFSGVRTFDRAQPKHTFTIARTKGKAGGKVVAFEYVEGPTQVWQARENASGTLEGKKLDLVVDEHRILAGFAVTDDLRESVKKAGLDPSFLETLDDALDGHAELSDVHSGARLRVIATEERIDGAFSRYTDVSAVEYFPANLKAEPIRVYHFTADSRARGYYDAKGRRPYRGGWRSPLPGSRISSRFNPRRKHPVLKIISPHNGVDFAAPPGTPVYSTAAGTVIHASDGGPCGNMVQVQHDGGLISAYCHLSRFASGLRTGQKVEARQLVGYVGQTGRATGPHLHFAIKKNGGFIDPLALKLDGVRVLPAANRGDFDDARRKLDQELDGIAVPAPVASPGAEAMADAGKPEDSEEVLDEVEQAH
jgi:murein DD-endopeptidase MepM/ murein hydrolase activator NlpD